MSRPSRSYWKLTRRDLARLRDFAIIEHRDFIRRNPRLEDSFRDFLVAICLCQGSASHYLDPSVGINDFDVWHFYFEDRIVSFPYRAHKRIQTGYRGKRIDFLKRAIPRGKRLSKNRPDLIVRRFLLERNNGTKVRLLRKAVIGLYPPSIFGKIIWRGDSSEELACA